MDTAAPDYSLVFRDRAVELIYSAGKLYHERYQRWYQFTTCGGARVRPSPHQHQRRCNDGGDNRRRAATNTATTTEIPPPHSRAEYTLGLGALLVAVQQGGVQGEGYGQNGVVECGVRYWLADTMLNVRMMLNAQGRDLDTWMPLEGVAVDAAGGVHGAGQAWQAGGGGYGSGGSVYGGGSGYGSGAFPPSGAGSGMRVTVAAVEEQLALAAQVSE